MPELSGKTVVFLRTSSVARIPVYQHLRALGLRMIVVHPFLNSAFDGCFDQWIESDTCDPAAVDAALTANGVVCADAYISFDEYAVYPAAVLSEMRNHRPIPLPSEQLKQTSIKSAFRRFCVEHNITAPKAVPILTPEDDIAALLTGANIQFPVVIKPSPGAGSLLAKLCTSLVDLKHHARYMWVTLQGHPDVKHLNAMGTSVHLLVEEYIGGQEVDIDVAVENGVVKFLAISDNFATVPPYFAERGGICPSQLGDVQQARLRALFQSFVDAHGSACHGVFHFEAKYDFDREDAYVIEVNCRMGSAETNTMIVATYGVQLGECLVRLGLELPLTNLPPAASTGLEPKQFCASVNVYPKAEGALKRVEIPVNDKSLVGFSLGAQPGSLVALPPKSFLLLCWMVAHGPTPEEAIENINRLTSQVVQEIATAQ